MQDETNGEIYENAFPTEYVEVWSWGELIAERQKAEARLANGEPINFCLVDWKGFTSDPPAINLELLRERGIGSVFEEHAHSKRSEALPYPVPRLPGLGPYEASHARFGLGDLTDAMFDAD